MSEITKRSSKQVIVMRTEFEVDGKKVTPRKGKYIAQGAHASLKAILDRMTEFSTDEKGNSTLNLYLPANSALHEWVTGRFTKICVSVKTEAELEDIYQKAKDRGIPCSMIVDAGLTEFGGNPTKTCCAIGPAWSDEIDKITGHLSPF